MIGEQITRLTQRNELRWASEVEIAPWYQVRLVTSSIPVNSVWFPIRDEMEIADQSLPGSRAALEIRNPIWTGIR